MTLRIVQFFDGKVFWFCGKNKRENEFFSKLCEKKPQSSTLKINDSVKCYRKTKTGCGDELTH